MKLLAFSIYDSKAEAFMRPYFAETKGLAVRSFRDAVNESGHGMNKYPEDYTLFHIGAFDPMTGSLEPIGTPVSMGLAITFLEKPS